jgi:hypothetical protein
LLDTRRIICPILVFGLANDLTFYFAPGAAAFVSLSNFLLLHRDGVNRSEDGNPKEQRTTIDKNEII